MIITAVLYIALTHKQTHARAHRRQLEKYQFDNFKKEHQAKYAHLS